MEEHSRIGRAARQSGFAYLLLLIFVATVVIASAAAVSLGARVARRDVEQELLAIGDEFERALRSYQGSSPIAGPQTLDELLKDPRSPSVKRHLRRVRVDPLTGGAEWGLVRGPGGAITGIYSLADGVPIKRFGFDEHHAAFENAQRYADWVFVARPGEAASAAQARIRVAK